LAQANLSSPPTLTFTVLSTCQFCIETAVIVQSNLAQIDITVEIQIQPMERSLYYTPYGTYSYEASNSSSIGHLSMWGGNTWASVALTPSDNWIAGLSNRSLFGNWAVYSNLTVQSCIDAFTSSSNLTHIQDLCRMAQAQVYNDAPYVWLGIDRLWYGSGSLVWQNGVVKSFLVDPTWEGQSTGPIFNTVTFG
jgi:ABC-type transport system substrate-binding protein